MMQRQITHPQGSFAACAGCRKEPRHFTAHGSARDEGPAFSVMGERHQLECCCERRTGWCDSLAGAVLRWQQLGETLPKVVMQVAKVIPLRAHCAGKDGPLEIRLDEA
ncbi:hypothetical protein [Dyella acidiphila]|uniref:Uncharacterized protein n=1 Tax=Dyella acidiphila TaxID=2775866 RepID=A0ABR9GED7_9GAMM|nr:hypothetical protein [Dyella acidiphila]MBE1162398.1 hypothetical protein [Dyella acidiphila]